VADALVDALGDPAASVRATAVSGLRELADVLRAEQRLAVRLRNAYGSTDTAVRDLVVELLRITDLGTVGDFRAAAEDSDVAVRLQAVRGLVRRDDTEGLGVAAADPAREVRVAAAHGLGTVADPRGVAALRALAGDPDLLVRAAALQATAGIDGPNPLAEVAIGLAGDPAWQVREGAAKALGSADPEVAVPVLLSAAGDAHIDVRRAAVRALARWADRDDVAAALRAADGDADADVRAYARQAMASYATPA
jgi:HEAT repeat protein